MKRYFLLFAPVLVFASALPHTSFAQSSYGSAPEPAATPTSTPTIDGKTSRKARKEAKKARKAARRKKASDTNACFNRSELKPWMLSAMLTSCDDLLALPVSKDDAWDWRAKLLQQRALVMST